MSPRELAEAYFQAWSDRRVDAVEPLLATDVDFVGALGTAHGAEECLDGLPRMFAMTDDVHVVRRWVDDEDVITWFELHAGGAVLPVVNWSHARDGRIDRIRVTFDPRPLFA